MSVDVIETTDGIASWAMSAKDRPATGAAACDRAASVASRCASERGVMFTELATTIPKTTAATIRAENERARLVLFSMTEILLLTLGSHCGTWGKRRQSRRHSSISRRPDGRG